MESIDNLTKIATKLEENDQTEIAKKIDKIAQTILFNKTAQFVGIQGYWIKNTRCWQNCYRQKRSETPTKSAQKAWEDCHEEYEKALNDDTTKWNKYASTDIKLDSDLAKNMINKLNHDFYKTMQKKIASGTSVKNSWMEATQQKFDKYSNRLIDASSDLVKLAGTLDPEKNKEDIESMLILSQDLIREAGVLGDMWNGIKGKGANYQSAMIALEEQDFPDLIDILQKLKATPIDKTVRTKYFSTIRRFYANLARANQTSGLASRGLKELFNRYSKILFGINDSIKKSTTPEEIQAAAERGILSLNQAAQQATQVNQQDQTQQQQQPQQQQPQQQQQQPTRKLNKTELGVIGKQENFSSSVMAILSDVEVRKYIYNLIIKNQNENPNNQPLSANVKNKIEKQAAIEMKRIYEINPQEFKDAFFSYLSNTSNPIDELYKVIANSTYKEDFDTYSMSQTQEQPTEQEVEQEVDKIELDSEEVIKYLQQMREKIVNLQKSDIEIKNSGQILAGFTSAEKSLRSTLALLATIESAGQKTI